MQVLSLSRFIPRWLPVILLIWFAVLQSFGVIHNAEHGFSKHSHYGHACQIFEYCEHQALSDDLPVIALHLLATLPPEANLPVAVAITLADAPYTTSPRAPPILS